MKPTLDDGMLALLVAVSGFSLGLAVGVALGLAL